MKDLFKLRGEISPQLSTAIGVTGLVLILATWFGITQAELVTRTILPHPLDVIKSFKPLHYEAFLIRNMLYSIKLNFIGYVEAVAVAIPLGFIIGLFPFFRALLSKYVDASRFIPLTAMTGLFIAWFGIEDAMKIHFLAFGIAIYLLPIVVQRIDEVEKVYVQTAKTLGASKWQIIRYVFIPTVISRVSDDIRVIVAISWTYIIVAELVNNSGGIGAMIYTAARQGRNEEVFALLGTIVFFGILQDRLLMWIDRVAFPHKYISD